MQGFIEGEVRLQCLLIQYKDEIKVIPWDILGERNVNANAEWVFAVYVDDFVDAVGCRQMNPCPARDSRFGDCDAVFQFEPLYLRQVFAHLTSHMLSIFAVLSDFRQYIVHWFCPEYYIVFVTDAPSVLPNPPLRMPSAQSSVVMPKGTNNA